VVLLVVVVVVVAAAAAISNVDYDFTFDKRTPSMILR
jgi:hypothetical protein